MFEAKSMLFIYVETPLHAGTGHGLGAVDLPIQRERITQYPIVQASSLKGSLRADAWSKTSNNSSPNEQMHGRLTAREFFAIFGPDIDKASDHAGALSVGDARILLFPVRSLAGVFAWTTSLDVLARFRRDALLVGWDCGRLKELTFTGPADNSALVSNDNTLQAGGSVVLEEFGFTATPCDAVNELGQWLAENFLPQAEEYEYWRQALPKKLCILPEDAFRDFVLYGTDVQTHIRLDQEKKTVMGRALWTSESLPVDTLLYAPLMATASRDAGFGLSAEQVLQKVVESASLRTRLGGDETTGQGWVALRFLQEAGQQK